MEVSKNPNFKNLLNEKFGRLTVIRYNGKNKNGRAIWICNCECDLGETIRKEKAISSNHLLRGDCISCGCLVKESPNNLKHGMTKTPEYKAWTSMKDRCYNSTLNQYKDYGGRGITICDRWLNSFENFYEDMGQRPSQEYSLDRVDNNGNYCKENCRWSTRKEQGNNKRNNHILEYDSQRLTIAEWSIKLNIDRNLIKNRLKYGWPIEKALTTPKRCNNEIV